MKLEFSGHNLEKKKTAQILPEILPVRAELFHADGRADNRDENNSLFFSKF